MAEQTDTPKKTQPKPAKGKTAESNNRTARQSHPARNRFLILLFLFVAVLAASAYLLMQLAVMQGRLDEVAVENTGLSETVAAQTATIESMQAQITQPAEPAQMDMTPLREMEQRLRQETDSLQRQLGEVSAAQRNQQVQPDLGWKIREAEYLLNLANLKLQLEADVAGAIVLFESADRALVEAQRDGALYIRQTIAEEIAQLRALEPLDREGVYFRLESLAGEITRLDLLLSLRESIASGGNAETDTAADSGFIASGLEFLGNVFVWRRWDERPEFELVAGQEEYIRESIRLQIEQAQLALLMRDAAMYRASLQAGLDQLQSYTGAGGGSAAGLAAEFGELLLIDIAPELPVLNQSLNQVGEFLAGEPQ